MKKGFGELLTESWKEYKNNLSTFIKIIFLLYFIPALLLVIINIFLVINFFGDASNLINKSIVELVIQNGYYTFIMAIV